ncbi:MAG TPA: GntR family transcriptional regulator [Luteimicrobium sp.]|nr:GntR family transcriptional regulator [Luteimicrobium sp.]
MAAGTKVQDELRAAILRGDFAPRQRLVEAELCEDFDAGRFAVRAALQALEAEGLVERQPNKGARIREITLAEAIEITEIRMVVEGLVASRAAERATPDDAARLRDIARRMRAAVKAGEPVVYSDLNADLHATLREIAQHETANRIIAQLHGQMVRHQFALSRVPGRSAVSLVQHENIVKAVVARDPGEAEAAMRLHIASVIDALRSMH